MGLLYQILRNVTQPACVCRGNHRVCLPSCFSLLATAKAGNSPQHWWREALAGMYILQVGWFANIISLNSFVVVWPYLCLISRTFLVSPCLAFPLSCVYLSSFTSQIKAVITRVRMGLSPVLFFSLLNSHDDNAGVGTTGKACACSGLRC